MNKHFVLTACAFIAVFIGMFLFDGTTNESYALTTSDCRTCHTGEPNWPNPYGAMMPAHHAFNRACGSCHIGTVPDSTNPDDPGYDCLTCHYLGTSIYNALDVTTAHAPVHDKTDVPSPECTTCHLPDAFGEHAKSPLFATPGGELDCDRCHKNTSPEVQTAIELGSGPTGQTVFCDDCHLNMATTTHEAAHDNALADSPDCLQCHAANVVTEHLNRGWTCATCHAGETATLDPIVVQNAITNGSTPNNQPQYCSTCHGANAGLHESVHDKTFLPADGFQDCTQCHVANVVTEHVTNQLLDCAVCHSSTRTDVFNAIEKGRTPSNQPVYCLDCHISQGKGHEPISVEPWDQCLRCHSSIGFGQLVHISHVARAQNDCSVCHAPAPSCTNCHDNNTSIPNVNIVGPGAEAHDLHTNTLQLDCLECHVSGAPGAAPIIEPFNQCDTCHTTQYGQLTHDTHLAVTNNNCAACHTPNPTCTSCHDIAGPATVTHDNHTNTYQVACATCHVSGVPGGTPIPEPFNTCDQCHTTLQPGEITHNSHETAATDATTGVVDCTICHSQQATCNQCHTAGDHSAAHDSVGVPSADCTNCHVADIVIEHVDTRGFTCATCHDSTASNVVAAITKGISGNFVSCYDCHGTNNHHATAEAQSGNCTFCHADPRLSIDQNAPTGQLACRQCHINNSGYVQTNSPAPSHAFNTNGNIQDFGACFACHTPVPYHAKPANRPSDCTVSTAIAPGKGSFNIFYSEYGGGSRSNPRNKSCQSQESNYNGPNINFNMISIVDHQHANSQYSVPTFGSNGGGTLPTPDIYLDPGALDFGSMQINDSLSKNSVIRNLGNAALTVSSITVGAGTSTEFTFSAPSVPFIIPVGGAMALTVTYQPVDAGTDNGNLVIISNDQDKSPISLSFTGTAESAPLPLPDINLTPSTLNFNSILVDNSATLQFQIQNTGNDDLVVSNVGRANGTSTEFTITAPATPFTVTAGNSQTISVTYSPTDEGPDTGSLLVSSNDPDEPTLSLVMSGVGETTPTPDISITPTALNFNNVVIGRTATRMLTIDNIGTAELNVSVIDRCQGTSAEFSWTPAGPLTILPNASGTVTISYTPTGEGTDTGCLIITNNAPNGSSTELGLSATAVIYKSSILSLLPAIINATQHTHFQPQKGNDGQQDGKREEN